MSEAISSGTLSMLIGSIYDCALDPAHWDRTLHDIRDALNGETAQLALVDRRRERFLISTQLGMTPELLEFQAAHASDVAAVITEFVAGNSLDAPHVLSRHLNRDDWERPYFQNALREGFVDTMACALIWDSRYFSALGVGRLQRQGVFGEQEIQLMVLLTPHLRRAVTISKVLDAQSVEAARMAETLDALKCGVVLTNATGAILHANRAAERMFRRGGPVEISRGALRARLPAAAKELHDALRLAAEDESAIGKTGLAIRLNEDDDPPLFAHVLPLTGSETRARLEPEAAAAVFIGADQDDVEAAEAVAAAFGLTPAESRVLESLLAGHTLAETAKASGVAVVTAKTHLESIFQKTGVNRQADLMRLAARAAPPVGPH